MTTNSMAGAQDNCGCNDWSKLTVNTGIATLTTANTSLLGTGTGVETVLTAASNGTIVKSVIIKATQPVTTGMVRLFITDGANISLYKEISVTTTPALTNTPTPAPVLPSFQVNLDGGLKLETGYSLLATTQTSQNFKVIAEGLNWAYASPKPPVCCNFKEETAQTGVSVISNANTNLDGTGTITQLLTVNGLYGNTIKRVTIKALQPTNEGMVRMFIGTGSPYALIKEIYIPETNPGGFEPTFKQVIEMDYNVQGAYVIGFSTQLAQNFAVTVETISWIYGY